MTNFWINTVSQLRTELPEQQFTTWIKPLRGVIQDNTLTLTASNRYVLQWVKDRFMGRIEEMALKEGRRCWRCDVEV